MADSSGRTDNDIIEMITGNACPRDFFRLLRQLELLLPQSSPIGIDGLPSEEIVQIRPEASFRFPPSAIARIETTNNKIIQFLMTITFFGLYGRYGTLPWHYTSRIIHQERPSLLDNRKPGYDLRAFLDIFNHRFASLFYRSGVKYRWPLTYRLHGRDETTKNFISFTGLKTLHLRDNLKIPDVALLRYAGLFTIPNSASSLATLLTDYLNMPVQIKQFEGEWLLIDETDRNQLSRQSVNNTIGRSFTIGKRIYSRQHRFRVVIGPARFDQFTSLLPDTKKFQQLVSLVRLRTGEAMKFDCAVKVDRRTVPKAAIGKNGVKVGRTFFLVSRIKQGPISCPVLKSELCTSAMSSENEAAEELGVEDEGRMHYV
ncbi:MAG TPA: type VI secretion system baseplate subunit TssG [Chitinispirillaceae bacterium]|nr:type VI secretion system baseplate subunit TssG [Chitinispirillaceae bacterium]